MLVVNKASKQAHAHIDIKEGLSTCPEKIIYIPVCAQLPCQINIFYWIVYLNMRSGVLKRRSE